MSVITLYRLLWGILDIDASAPMIPTVPKHTIKGEDKTIPRICTSVCLDGCLTGISPAIIGLNFFADVIDKKGRGALKESLEKPAFFPFTVLTFSVDRDTTNVLLPGKIIEHVPDADFSGECWITDPVTPLEVSHLWLVDGKIEETYLILNGEGFRYLCVSDSVWSKEPAPATESFRDAIFDAAHQWLKEN